MDHRGRLSRVRWVELLGGQSQALPTLFYSEMYTATGVGRATTSPLKKARKKSSAERKNLVLKKVSMDTPAIHHMTLGHAAGRSRLARQFEHNAQRCDAERHSRERQQDLDGGCRSTFLIRPRRES